MIVAAHQPHFLPWLGYLDKMLSADLFVILDHVQFERRGYQNRTRILVDGVMHWLTVPVVQRSQQERVIDKEIDKPLNGEKKCWGNKHFQTLRHAYRDAPFFDLYGSRLQKMLEAGHDKLVDLNQLTLNFLRDALDIRTPVINSSELNIKGVRSDMILDVCKAVGADTYLAGMGGSRDYLEEQTFADAGIGIAWQDFRHPVYSQCGGGAFVPGLSAVDLLFNHGPQSREIMTGATQEARIAALA